MSRTLNEIYNALVADKEAREELDGINSTSQTAIYKGMMWIAAFCSWTLESLWDVRKTELENAARTVIAGTGDWWRARVLEWQYGDELEMIDGVYKYATIDLENRLVARCAIVEAENEVLVKVAKLVDGSLVALEAGELSDLQSYINLIKFAGTRVRAVSYAADNLGFIIDIHFSAISGFAAVKAGCIAAVENYLANLTFNGKVYESKLIDAMQAVVGVEDVFKQSISAKYGAGDYTAFSRLYAPTAGFIQIEDNEFTDTANPDGSVTSTNGAGATFNFIPFVNA
jgi:hypothetical protein